MASTAYARGMRRLTTGLMFVAVAVASWVLGLCAQRIATLERTELEHTTEPRSLAAHAGTRGSTRVSARLTQVALNRGEHALFELCSSDAGAFAPARWRNAFELAVFRLPEMELMLRVPLDDAHLGAAKRGASGACLPLGGGEIERSGDYSVDAVWPRAAPAAAVMRTPLQLRVLARTPLSDRDRALVIMLGLAVLLGLMAWTLRPVELAPNPASSPALGTLGAMGAAALLPLLAVVALTQLPSEGAVETLEKGALLVALQALAPWAIGRSLSVPLGTVLTPPARPLLFAAVAVVAAGLLVLVAQLSLALIPATGEAPIQTFVGWPSGMLCFAALGTLLPVGEELLFRGYLWSLAARATGRTGAAAAATWGLFVLLHAQQSWGNWGGLLAIAATGAVLTGLRIASGSVVVPALAHVLYNFALSVTSF